MDEKQWIERLMKFGLTRQEATLYHCLLLEGKLTGYELAKLTGISRSNAYSSVATLVEKGAAYVQDESARKYVAMKPKEFCENYIHDLELEKKYLMEHEPKEKQAQEGYITIEGEDNIRNKMRNLIQGTKQWLYLSGNKDTITELSEELNDVIEQKKKVVLITDDKISIKGATIYYTRDREAQLGMIVDTKSVISGEYGTGSQNTCLYSGQKNFVELFRNALKNEIKLIELTKGEH